MGHIHTVRQVKRTARYSPGPYTDTIEEGAITTNRPQGARRGSGSWNSEKEFLYRERCLTGVGRGREGRRAPDLVFLFLAILQPMLPTDHTQLVARGQGCLPKHPERTSSWVSEQGVKEG